MFGKMQILPFMYIAVPLRGTIIKFIGEKYENQEANFKLST